jgi:hypothetical protein
MTWLASEAGQVHRQEGGVSSEQCEPEVEAAQGLGHETCWFSAMGGNLRKPVISRGEEGEDSGHCHDEMEVSHDEEGVVEVLVEDGLGEDWAGEASGDEERDEAEREEHCGGVLWAAAPSSGDPTEDFSGRRKGDGHGRDRKSRASEGIQACDEHVMAPEEDAEESDEQGGGDHGAVGEDTAMAEVCQQHRGESHAWEDSDVDLRVSEEPEEMEPKERASVAFCMKNSVDEVSGGKEEAGSGMTIAEEEKQGGEKDGKGDDAEERGGEPSPDRKGKTVPGHTFAAKTDYCYESVNCGDGRSDREQRYAD